MAKCLAISSFSFGLQSVTKGGSRGKNTHLIKLLLIVIYVEEQESNCSSNRRFFALPQELKEWQVDLPRTWNEASRQMMMSPFLTETGAAVRSLIWNKVFRKGSHLFILPLKTWWSWKTRGHGVEIFYVGQWVKLNLAEWIGGEECKSDQFKQVAVCVLRTWVDSIFHF